MRVMTVAAMAALMVLGPMGCRDKGTSKTKTDKTEVKKGDKTIELKFDKGVDAKKKIIRVAAMEIA